MTRGNEFVVAYVPDFNINTQGREYAEAIEMARDAICLVGVDMEDNGEPLPKSTPISKIKSDTSGDKVVTLVEVDFAAYRSKLAQQTVLKS